MKSHPYWYWTSTSVLGACMLFAAFAYLTGRPGVMEVFASLGYPAYFPVILGFAKLAGALVLLAPEIPRGKEWAYAGFTITFVGAILSHLFVDQFGAALLPFAALALLVISYVTRPLSRRLLTTTAMQEVDADGHVHTIFQTTEAH